MKRLVLADTLRTKTESEFAKEMKIAIPGFEEEDFLEWVSDRFVKFQKSWSKGAIEEIHPFETDRLFEMHSMQLAELKQKNVSNYIDGISVKEVNLVGFSNKLDSYEAVVHVKANLRNYFIDQNNLSEAYSMNLAEPFHYYLTFEKKKHNRKLAMCPACTAPLLPNADHCEYCHLHFPDAMDQWMLAQMEVQ